MGDIIFATIATGRTVTENNNTNTILMHEHKGQYNEFNEIKSIYIFFFSSSSSSSSNNNNNNNYKALSSSSLSLSHTHYSFLYIFGIIWTISLLSLSI